MTFFSFFNVNPTIVTMKKPNHLLNATEARTGRNGVKTDHAKILNGLTSYTCQIFKQNPLFFIT